MGELTDLDVTVKILGALFVAIVIIGLCLWGDEFYYRARERHRREQERQRD